MTTGNDAASPRRAGPIDLVRSDGQCGGDLSRSVTGGVGGEQCSYARITSRPNAPTPNIRGTRSKVYPCLRRGISREDHTKMKESKRNPKNLGGDLK